MVVALSMACFRLSQLGDSSLVSVSGASLYSRIVPVADRNAAVNTPPAV